MGTASAPMSGPRCVIPVADSDDAPGTTVRASRSRSRCCREACATVPIGALRRDLTLAPRPELQIIVYFRKSGQIADEWLAEATQFDCCHARNLTLRCWQPRWPKGAEWVLACLRWQWVDAVRLPPANTVRLVGSVCPCRRAGHETGQKPLGGRSSSSARRVRARLGAFPSHRVAVRREQRPQPRRARIHGRRRLGHRGPGASRVHPDGADHGTRYRRP